MSNESRIGHITCPSRPLFTYWPDAAGETEREQNKAADEQELSARLQVAKADDEELLLCLHLEKCSSLS